jgi:hypothetical protein
MMNDDGEKIEIRKVDNGYILSETNLYEINEKGVKVYNTNTEVIEEDDDGEKACLKKLLERIAETCGYDYDKFGLENLNITFDKKGHKVD